MEAMTTTLNDHLSTEAPATPAPASAGGPTWADFRALEERVEQGSIRRSGWTLFIWAFSAVALVFSIVGIGLGSRAIGQSKRNVRDGSAPSAAGAPIAASPGPVTLSDFHVRPASSTIAAGKVTFQISNAGKVQHEFLVFRSNLAPSAYPIKGGNIDEEGPGITKVSDGDDLDPGATQTRSVDLTQPGTYLFVCNLPGHFRAGMYSVVTVK
jgi:uncharacterized cupredoxin-like copper-binding protein